MTPSGYARIFSITTRLRGGMQAEANRGRARGGTTSIDAFELLLRGRAHSGDELVDADAMITGKAAGIPNYVDVRDVVRRRAGEANREELAGARYSTSIPRLS